MQGLSAQEHRRRKLEELKQQRQLGRQTRSYCDSIDDILSL